MTQLDPSRRNVLAGIAAAGVAAPVLAACGSNGSDVTGKAPADPATTHAPAASPANGGIQTSAIPVGGGEILPDKNVVITQPSAGQFKAFSATCTHAGCQVAFITHGQIICPCHGSAFSITDGSVVSPPATQPLQPLTVTVTGTTLTVT